MEFNVVAWGNAEIGYSREAGATREAEGIGNNGYHLDVYKILMPILAEGLRNLHSDCFKAFDALGKSTIDLALMSLNLEFFDATTQAGNLTQHQIGGNGVFHTLTQSAPQANAYTIRARDGSRTNNVVVKAGFYVQPARKQGLILVHELLHFAFNAGDEELFKRLRIPARFGDEPSPALTDWLNAGCPRQ